MPQDSDAVQEMDFEGEINPMGDLPMRPVGFIPPYSLEQAIHLLDQRRLRMERMMATTEGEIQHNYEVRAGELEWSLDILRKTRIA